MAGAGRAIAALVLVAGGGALVYMALQTQDERDAAIAADAAKKAARTPPPVATPAPTPMPTHAPSSPAPVASAAPTASASASASAAPSASAPASASSAGEAPSGEVFRFTKGGIVIPPPELHRLVQTVGQMRSQPKILIEAYGDEAGSGDKGLGLAKRRAYLVRQLLSDDMGIEGERLVIKTNDVATDESLAGTVRVRGGTSTEGKTP